MAAPCLLLPRTRLDAPPRADASRARALRAATVDGARRRDTAPTAPTSALPPAPAASGRGAAGSAPPPIPPSLAPARLPVNRALPRRHVAGVPTPTSALRGRRRVRPSARALSSGSSALPTRVATATRSPTAVTAQVPLGADGARATIAAPAARGRDPPELRARTGSGLPPPARHCPLTLLQPLHLFAPVAL